MVDDEAGGTGRYRVQGEVMTVALSSERAKEPAGIHLAAVVSQVDDIAVPDGVGPIDGSRELIQR